MWLFEYIRHLAFFNVTNIHFFMLYGKDNILYTSLQIYIYCTFFVYKTYYLYHILLRLICNQQYKWEVCGRQNRRCPLINISTLKVRRRIALIFLTHILYANKLIFSLNAFVVSSITLFQLIIYAYRSWTVSFTLKWIHCAFTVLASFQWLL